MPTRAFANGALWLAVFLGGFVFVEPSPYDLFLAALIPAWMVVGLKVPRAASPLVLLMLLFLAGGVIAATQATHLDAQPIYYAITAFLALSACFFACLIAEDPKRLDLIVGAWIAAALVTTLLGVAGYFGFSPDGFFVKFERAAGGFQDPNVFGPFLILPFAVLVRRAWTRPFGQAALSSAMALVILFGMFLSFSRATWGLSVITVFLSGLLLFVTERSISARMRFITISLIGVTAAAVLIAVALSFPAVSDLFSQRAHVEQSYDIAHLGRFQRYGIGFNMMLDHPLGIGALEFGRLFGEDEHDIWLKCLTTYGWLGFAAYFTLVVWTLVAAFPLVFRSGPLQPVVQIAYIVLLGHVIMATVIDIDHWRHVYLLFGLLWGAIAADRATRQARLGAYYRRHLVRGDPLPLNG